MTIAKIDGQHLVLNKPVRVDSYAAAIRILAENGLVGEELRTALEFSSRAYGSVAGALGTWAGLRDGAERDRAWSQLLDAIDAPRVEAQQIARRLARVVRGLQDRGYADESGARWASIVEVTP